MSDLVRGFCREAAYLNTRLGQGLIKIIDIRIERSLNVSNEPHVPWSLSWILHTSAGEGIGEPLAVLREDGVPFGVKLVWKRLLEQRVEDRTKVRPDETQVL